MPEAFNNRFHDLLLEKEVAIEDLKVDNHILREKDKNRVKKIIKFSVTFFTFGTITGIITGYKLGRI
jgi:hypothetical protein